MFKKLGPQLVEGKKYRLLKKLVDPFKRYEITPPHVFTYKGLMGVGDHQDQHEFVDGDGNMVAFCPALGSKYGYWYDFLAPLHQKAKG